MPCQHLVPGQRHHRPACQPCLHRRTREALDLARLQERESGGESVIAFGVVDETKVDDPAFQAPGDHEGSGGVALPDQHEVEVERRAGVAQHGTKGFQ
jgi:hypothetical protein